jgi:hypothetical protein
MEFKECLLEQAKRYPEMQALDYLKLAYQSAYGCEHLLKDIDHAKAYFDEEYASTKKTSALPLSEEIGNGVCRVNLGVWKSGGYEDFALFELFLRSAQPKANGPAIFVTNCKIVTQAIEEGQIPLAFTDWKESLAEKEIAGPGPVHHSEHYEKAYDPHYRVIDSALLEDFLSSLSHLNF